MFQHDSASTNFDTISYVHYATGYNSKYMPFNFLQSAMLQDGKPKILTRQWQQIFFFSKASRPGLVFCGTRELFFRWGLKEKGVRPTTDVVARLCMSAAIPPILHMSPWEDASLSKGASLPFYDRY
jgi:hypothetical protein